MIQNIFQALIDLFFPEYCSVCDTALIQNEKTICTTCLYHLPKTNYHNESHNPVEQLFWGRVPVKNATAYFHYRKGSQIKKLLHKLKYKNKKEIAYHLGSYYGEQLKNSERYSTIDNIIPVPLHPKKQQKRGYNQSEIFAKGLAKAYNKPVVSDSLFKVKENETQTNKGRYQRWENTIDIFQVVNPEQFENKHILIVDDVVTTGSTIEACITPLLKIKNISISVATLACASLK